MTKKTFFQNFTGNESVRSLERAIKCALYPYGRFETMIYYFFDKILKTRAKQRVQYRHSPTYL